MLTPMIEPDLLRQLELKEGATEEALAALQESLGTRLPADYLDLLRYSNGAVGIGPNLFVILAPAEEVAENTSGYGAPKYAPGLIIFGSDGCGNLLGIDTRNPEPAAMEYVLFDAICLDWDEENGRVKSLSDLLRIPAQYGEEDYR